jgi:hypothetical protein
MLAAIGDQLRPPPASSWHEHSRAARAPSVWTTCPKCKGDRVLVWKQRPVKCDHRYCQGQGGWYVDPYDLTLSPVSTVENEHLAPARRIMCLECSGVGSYPNGHLCRLCKGVGELVLWAAEDMAVVLGDRAEEAAGGRGEAETMLLVALDDLHLVEPAEHFLVWYSLILELQPAEALVLPMRQLVVRGVLRLDGLLEPGWRAPGWARRRAVELEAVHAERRRRAAGHGRWGDPARREDRDREVKRLVGNGRSVRQIAEQMGMKRSTVTRVLDRSREGA